MKGNTVERYYKRVDDLDEKIRDMNLLYIEWKLLFLIGDRTSVAELKDLIGKEEELIITSLETLVQKGLLRK